MTKEDIKGRLLGLKLKKALAEDRNKRASRLLFYVGTAYLLFGLMQTEKFITTLFISSISLVLITLGILSRKNPLFPLVVGFVVLLSASCVDFMHFERIGFLGLIIRVVLLGFLGSGIYHIFAADRVLSEYDHLKNQARK